VKLFCSADRCKDYGIILFFLQLQRRWNFPVPLSTRTMEELFMVCLLLEGWVYYPVLHVATRMMVLRCSTCVQLGDWWNYPVPSTAAAGNMMELSCSTYSWQNCVTILFYLQLAGKQKHPILATATGMV
jgi:hypothetical protein